jgi:serine/threonine-protein kinase
VHPVIGKQVAIKVLRPELAADPVAVKRLLEEARALATAKHRGIVDILGFGTLPHGERQYLVMEYLEGEGLDQVMHQAGALAPIEAVRLLEEILAAIGAAHSAGVLHRDLKPSNVFLVRQTGTRFVKLLDFGMAKRTAPGQEMSQMTTKGLAVGTPHYIAPEQAAGKKVGPPTDLYSIGVIAFEMVTGRLPFVTKNPLELLRLHVEERAPRASSVFRNVPKMLDGLISSLLEKDPARRPRSAAEVLRVLANVKMAIAMGKTITGR